MLYHSSGANGGLLRSRSFIKILIGFHGPLSHPAPFSSMSVSTPSTHSLACMSMYKLERIQGCPAPGCLVYRFAVGSTRRGAALVFPRAQFLRILLRLSTKLGSSAGRAAAWREASHSRLLCESLYWSCMPT